MILAGKKVVLTGKERPAFIRSACVQPLKATETHPAHAGRRPGSRGRP